MSSGSPREPEPAIYWGDPTAHELARCQANFDKLSKHFQTSDQVSEDEAVAMLQTCGFSSEVCDEILHEIYTGGAWAFYTPPPACPTSPWASGNRQATSIAAEEDLGLKCFEAAVRKAAEEGAARLAAEEKARAAIAVGAFYTPPPACPTSPWASGSPVTPANLFGSGTCRTKDKQHCAGADIDAGEAAINFDSCDPAAPPVQPTTAAPSVQPTNDPITGQRTVLESGDVATGTQVVPLSSAPSSRNPALHKRQPVPLVPPEHRRTAEQGTNTEPQIRLGPSHDSYLGWRESPVDQRRITPKKPGAGPGPGRNRWDQLYNAHWGIGGPIPYWSPFYDDFGNVSWYHRDRETGHMTWRTSPPATDHLLWSYANDQTGVIHYYPGPTPLKDQTEDASWYVETTPYHADVALTTTDPLTQPPRAKEVQFIDELVSEPQSWPQDEATVFAASSSPSSTHLGLMLHKDKRLRHSTAEKCTGIKPKESSLPRGPSKFKPSAAAKAAKKAAADYDQSHKAFYETRDTPPTAPDLYSPYHDEDNDDYDDDG